MAIAKVQSFSAHGTVNATSLTTGAFTALTAGNIVVVAGVAASPCGTMTENAGDIEWEAQNISSVGSSVSGMMYLGRIMTGGATTVTLGFGTGTGAIAMAGIEFSGFTRARRDRTNQLNGTTSPASSGALVTTASANQLWIGTVAARNDTFSSETINTVAKDFQVSDATTYGATTANRSVDLFYRIVSSTGTPNCSVTLGATTVWQCGLMAIEETPAGGAVTTAYAFA